MSFLPGTTRLLPRLPVSVTLAGLSIPTSAMVQCGEFADPWRRCRYMRIRSMRFLRAIWRRRCMRSA